DRLHRPRLAVLARRVPRADRARDGLEPRRDLDGRAAQLGRDGTRLVLLGRALRPHRRARRRARRRLSARARPRARQPGAGAVALLPQLRRPGWLRWWGSPRASRAAPPTRGRSSTW